LGKDIRILILPIDRQKSEGKRPLLRPRLRWEDNLKMDLIKIGLGGMDWIDLAQGRDQ
jgi:hypothetical protein